MAAAAKHRDTLVESALTLFRRQGYSGTGLAEILASSGAPKGSLYHYFPEGKEAIAEAALLRFGERVTARLRAGAAIVPDAKTMVRNFAGAMMQDMQESGFRGGCPVAAIMVEAAGTAPRLVAVGAEVYRQWAEIFAAKLVQDGAAPARAQELGLFVVCAMQGALMLARTLGDVAPLRAAAAELQESFTHALRAAPNARVEGEVS